MSRTAGQADCPRQTRLADRYPGANTDRSARREGWAAVLKPDRALGGVPSESRAGFASMHPSVVPLAVGATVCGKSHLARPAYPASLPNTASAPPTAHHRSSICDVCRACTPLDRRCHLPKIRRHHIGLKGQERSRRPVGRVRACRRPGVHGPMCLPARARRCLSAYGYFLQSSVRHESGSNAAGSRRTDSTRRWAPGQCHAGRRRSRCIHRSWPLTRMEDREDHDSLGLDRVKHTMFKAPYRPTPHAVNQLLHCQRLLGQRPNGSLDRGHEPRAQ